MDAFFMVLRGLAGTTTTSDSCTRSASDAWQVAVNTSL
ncbi:hypothetical protein JCM19231_3126 [Vibrio ishigakensis]|uniref:Uncharacterized protein n=1 Tax=Vibrio ishigakensis TaxID=1481914 RepID=A0A0B8NWP2_9VIBR|nr:hypothetical protein JCM19231_3126 [Vibrio ishigakensis]